MPGPSALSLDIAQHEAALAGQLRRERMQKQRQQEAVSARPALSNLGVDPAERLTVGAGQEAEKGDQANVGSSSARKQATALGQQYRQQIQSARNQGGAKGALDQLKDQAMDVGASAISQGTSKLLQQAWFNLIDSFGATLIWINIHVFCRFVFGEKFFCKLGHEWIPKVGKGMSGTGAATQAGTSGAKQAGSAGEGGAVGLILGLPQGGIGLIEAGVLALLDAILILLILISLFWVFLIWYLIFGAVEVVVDFVDKATSPGSLGIIKNLPAFRNFGF